MLDTRDNMLPEQVHELGPFKSYRHSSLATRTLTWLVAGILGLLSACTIIPNAPLIDRSFLTQQPCASPCWYGLEINKSDKEDVYSVLKERSFIDQLTIREGGSVWQDDQFAYELQWDCLSPKTSNCGGVLLSKNKLKMIWFSPADLNFRVVVDKLGLPDYVEYGVIPPRDFHISLVWREKGVIVNNVDRQSDALFQAVRSGKSIPIHTKVSEIFYVAHDGFTEKPGDCCHRILWPGFEQ